MLKAKRSSYQFKVIYDSSSNMDCPLFNFRIAQKPIEMLLDQNLKCLKRSPPPGEIEVTQEEWEYSDNLAFSTSFMSENFKKVGTLTYEIKLKGEVSSLDAELDFDFLTNDMNIALVDKDGNTLSSGETILRHDLGSTNDDGRKSIRLSHVSLAF